MKFAQHRSRKNMDRACQKGCLSKRVWQGTIKGSEWLLYLASVIIHI
jgi:hypothetical protein